MAAKGKLLLDTLNTKESFFWWDDTYPLTQEAMGAFEKYNLLQDDENGTIQIPNAFVDGSKKVVHYYYCNSDPMVFKKVITNIGLGYYDPPNLNCSK